MILVWYSQIHCVNFVRLAHYRNDYRVGEVDGYGNVLSEIYVYETKKDKYLSITDLEEYNKSTYFEFLKNSRNKKKKKKKIKMLLDDLGRLIYKKLNKRYGQPPMIVRDERYYYMKYRR